MAPGVIQGPSDPVATPPKRAPRFGATHLLCPHVLARRPHGGSAARGSGPADLFTPVEGDPEVLSHADLVAVPAACATSRQSKRTPSRPVCSSSWAALPAATCAKQSRGALPEEVEAGTPLYLLLDDLAGASLISGFAFFKWAKQVPQIKERVSSAPTKLMLGICSGFREGSSALNPDGTLLAVSDNTPHPQPLTDPTDPLGWHELHPPPEIAMRRARRIDVWWEDGALQIDAMFRDSVWDPDGLECVLHEYQLPGWADADGTLRAITAVPRVLPYQECPLAAPNASWLEGTPMRALRAERSCSG